MFENSFLLLLASAEQTEELSPQYLIKQLIGLKKMPLGLNKFGRNEQKAYLCHHKKVL